MADPQDPLNVPQKGLLSLKFMQRGLEKQKAEAKAMLQQLQADLRAEARAALRDDDGAMDDRASDDEDEEEADAPSTAPGRRQFGLTRAAPTPRASRAGGDDDEPAGEGALLLNDEDEDGDDDSMRELGVDNRVDERRTVQTTAATVTKVSAKAAAAAATADYAPKRASTSAISARTVGPVTVNGAARASVRALPTAGASDTTAKAPDADEIRGAVGDEDQSDAGNEGQEHDDDDDDVVLDTEALSVAGEALRQAAVQPFVMTQRELVARAFAGDNVLIEVRTRNNVVYRIKVGLLMLVQRPPRSCCVQLGL